MIDCKVCGGAAPLHGVCDMNKSCEAHRGRFFELLGRPVWYQRCATCGFLFTGYFDGWSLSAWRGMIYNAEYDQFDPDGADGSRARANVALTLDVARRMGAARILDYGAGNGLLARHLIEAHSDCVSWDVFDNVPLPAGPFDLVTAFEVLEHTPTPIETAREALSRVRAGGRFLFSTLLCDDLPPQAMDWWYASPRNGHVSIYTSKSLEILFSGLGWQVQHLSPGLHIAQR